MGGLGKAIVYLPALVLLGTCCSPAQQAKPESFQLKTGELKKSISTLRKNDRKAVNDAIELIRQGRHTLALARLTALSDRGLTQSAIRILTSYAQIQLGNLLGAYEEAEKAHEAHDGNAYVCWFLGKVALLSGKDAICERELKHLRSVPGMKREAGQLERELAAKRGRSG